MTLFFPHLWRACESLGNSRLNLPGEGKTVLWIFFMKCSDSPVSRSLCDDLEADLSKHAGLMLSTQARCTLQLQSHEVEIWSLWGGPWWLSRFSQSSWATCPVAPLLNRHTPSHLRHHLMTHRGSSCPSAGLSAWLILEHSWVITGAYTASVSFLSTFWFNWRVTTSSCGLTLNWGVQEDTPVVKDIADTHLRR